MKQLKSNQALDTLVKLTKSKNIKKIYNAKMDLLNAIREECSEQINLSLTITKKSLQ